MISQHAQLQMTPEAQAEIRNMADRITSVPNGFECLTYWNGKIYKGFGTWKENYMVDVNLLNKGYLGAAKGESIENIHAFSQNFKNIYDNYLKAKKLIEKNPDIPVQELLGAASPLLSTDYTTVRRINDLAEIKGPQHVLAQYNAINVVTIRPTSNFYLRGFVRSAILQGHKEIGDHTTPPASLNAYTQYEVDLMADAYRYETTLRERNEVAFNLEQQYQQDVSGIIAKMKNDKIVAALNILTGTDAPDWNVVTNGVWTNDAASKIAEAEDILQSYGGATQVIWPFDSARAYDRNVGGAPPTTSGIGMPESTIPLYQKRLSRNPNLMGWENNGITSKHAIIMSLMWASLYQGPEILIAYQNQMTPGQVEGRIIFNFNKFSQELTSAAVKYTGVIV